MKDVQIVSLDKRVDSYIEWMNSIPSMMKEYLKQDNPEEALKLIRKIELIEVGAQKVKLSEVTKKAAITRLTLMREMGSFLKRRISKGGAIKENVLGRIGISKRESVTYQKLADMPEFHWNHAMDIKPSVGYLLRECDRADSIKEIITKLKMPKKFDSAKIETIFKNLIEKNFQPFAAETLLREQLKLKTDDVELDYELDGEEAEEDIEAGYVEMLEASDIEIFKKNSKDISDYFKTFIELMSKLKSIKKQQFRVIKKSVELVANKLEEVLLAFNELEERIKE